MQPARLAARPGCAGDAAADVYDAQLMPGGAEAAGAAWISEVGGGGRCPERARMSSEVTVTMRLGTVVYMLVT
jgi:hypothetical protein